MVKLIAICLAFNWILFWPREFGENRVNNYLSIACDLNSGGYAVELFFIVIYQSPAFFLILWGTYFDFLITFLSHGPSGSRTFRLVLGPSDWFLTLIWSPHHARHWPHPSRNLPSLFPPFFHSFSLLFFKCLSFFCSLSLSFSSTLSRQFFSLILPPSKILNVLSTHIHHFYPSLPLPPSSTKEPGH